MDIHPAPSAERNAASTTDVHGDGFTIPSSSPETLAYVLVTMSEEEKPTEEAPVADEDAPAKEEESTATFEPVVGHSLSQSHTDSVFALHHSHITP